LQWEALLKEVLILLVITILEILEDAFQKLQEGKPVVLSNLHIMLIVLNGSRRA
jgi:hypothetical protein